MSQKFSRTKPLEQLKLPIIFVNGNEEDLPDMKPFVRDEITIKEEYEEYEEISQPGTTIPIPDVSIVEDYETLNPPCYETKPPLIRAQFELNLDEAIDYDADSEDDEWIQQQSRRLDLDICTFEMIVDRLEKESAHAVISLEELMDMMNLKRGVVTAVYDYWLHKRLMARSPLSPKIKLIQKGDFYDRKNPYNVFIARPEKRLLRKNRRLDEIAYMNMLKLKEDMTKTLNLLKLVECREIIKAEKVAVNLMIFNKRYEMRDFSGEVYTNVLTDLIRQQINNERQSFIQLQPGNYQYHLLPERFQRQLTLNQPEDFEAPLKRQKIIQSDLEIDLPASNDLNNNTSDEENPYEFVPREGCSYHEPVPYDDGGLWRSERQPRPFSRNRLGRGGRLVIAPFCNSYDEVWASSDFSIFESTT